MFRIDPVIAEIDQAFDFLKERGFTRVDRVDRAIPYGSVEYRTKTVEVIVKIELYRLPWVIITDPTREVDYGEVPRMRSVASARIDELRARESAEYLPAGHPDQSWEGDVQRWESWVGEAALEVVRDAARVLRDSPDLIERPFGPEDEVDDWDDE